MNVYYCQVTDLRARLDERINKDSEPSAIGLFKMFMKIDKMKSSLTYFYILLGTYQQAFCALVYEIPTLRLCSCYIDMKIDIYIDLRTASMSLPLSTEAPFPLTRHTYVSPSSPSPLTDSKIVNDVSKICFNVRFIRPSWCIYEIKIQSIS